MKKYIAIVSVVLALSLVGAFFYFKDRRYEVVIRQEQIDAELSRRFPASKTYLLIFSVTYSNPRSMLLEEDDRVQVALDATLNIRLDGEPKELGGSATATTGIRYDTETQEFFLDDGELDRLEIQGIPDEWSERVTEFASKAAREFIETKPVYKLEAEDAKTAAAKLLLKDFEVRDQAIYVTLGI